MIRLAFSFVRADGKRIGSIFGVLLLAVSSFVLLMSSTTAEKAHVTGTLQANWRGTYDILVRPHDSQTEEDKQHGIVAPNFLSGIYGGITLSQLEKIRSLAHVEVAAPIAMIGAINSYLFPSLTMPIPSEMRGKRAIVKRAEATISSRQGKYRMTSPQTYTYYSPFPIAYRQENADNAYESMPEHEEIQVCSGNLDDDFAYNTCIGNTHDSYSIYAPEIDFSLFFAAIDPQAEAALSHIDHAVTDGRYLLDDEGIGTATLAIGNNQFEEKVIPVLLSSNFGRVDLTTHVESHVLPPDLAEQAYSQASATSQAKNPLLKEQITHATPAFTWSTNVDFSTYWQEFLRQHAPLSDYHMQNTVIDAPRLITPMQYATVGPIRYSSTQDTESSAIMPNNSHMPSALIAHSSPSSYTSEETPNPGSLGPQFREKTSFTFPRTALLPVGFFDPSKIEGAQTVPHTVKNTDGNVFLGSSPLGTYQESAITIADISHMNNGEQGDVQAKEGKNESKEKTLRAQYSPDLNLQGYALSPPALLTSLDAYIEAFRSLEGGEEKTAAPISAIRVRVAGVETMNDISAEKIRNVAENISRHTGLTVDIMSGASLSPRRILLEGEGKDGGMLAVNELWSKKGVLTTISQALDQKTFFLSLLIILSSLFTVAIGISAFLHSHAQDFRTLTTLGWARSNLVRLQLTIIVLIGSAAGISAVLLSFGIARFLKITLPLWLSGLAFPLAVAVSVFAAIPSFLRSFDRTRHFYGRFIPIRRNAHTPFQGNAHNLRRTCAARMTPRNGVSAFQIGTSRLRSHFMRTITAGVAIVLAVTSLSFTSVVLTEFRGSLVGSILGDVISVQIRSADIFAIGSLAIMGVACVAVAQWISAVEDAFIYSTLYALGWPAHMIGAAIVSQSGTLGGVGSMCAAILTWAALASIGMLSSTAIAISAVASAVYFACVVICGSVPALIFLRRSIART